MKVILQRDVPKVGKTGDIVQVKDGYARNYLFPRLFAVQATGGAMKEHDARITHEKQRDAKRLQTAQSEGTKLEGLKLTLLGKVGSGTKLFGSITAQEVADAIARETGVTIDKRRIGLADPIKTIGSYTIAVRLHSDITVPVPVEVITEEERTRRIELAAAEKAASEKAAQEALEAPIVSESSDASAAGETL